MMADDLSRQANELAALSAMYGSAEGESFTVGEITSTGELACTLTVCDASLSVELPQGYPSAEPPRVSVSCPIMPTASCEELAQELDQIAADGAATDREILFELLQAFQQRMAELPALQLKQQPSSSHASEARSLPTSRAARLIWYHHIKSQEKRKNIVAWARDRKLRGFCKPGFPGVIAVEGEAAACAEYVGELRALRWQAMEVRWEATDLPTDAPLGLPEPFAELAESAMGEAAALCEKAGLLAAFRTAVLKLEKG